MRQEKRRSINFGLFSAVLFTVLLTACGTKGEDITMPNTDFQDEIQEPTLDDNGSMEIYSGREVISLSDDMLVGQAAVGDILQGKPVLYDRFITDGFVFEWIVSDYEYDDNIFLEDGVLIISKEDNSEDTQVIHVQAEGGYGGPVSLNNKSHLQ